MLNLSKEVASVGHAFFPRGVLLAEQLSAALRAYLDQNELEHYVAYHWDDFELQEIGDMLEELGEKGAEWRSIPAVTAGEPMAGISTDDENKLKQIGFGALHLPRRDVLVARWLWLDTKYYNETHFWMIAAPSVAHIERLRADVLAIRRQKAKAQWQIVRGAEGPACYEHSPRDAASSDDLVIDAGIYERIENDAIGFFSDPVARLYRSLKVPYRRGILMYGPPGNGKTSIIRWIGAQLPSLPMMLLRPNQNFDTDMLEAVLTHWREQAPAALIIEDLDWLLQRVNVSNFLNALDGVESNRNDGLLLIATTNHPEKLDPAVNNRPGRFDVMIEVPPPNDELRRRYLIRKLPALEAAMLDELARGTDGLSFCHLIEIVRLSGMIAISKGREDRTDDDLRRAMQLVAHAHTAAEKNFAPPPDSPFGLRSKKQG